MQKMDEKQEDKLIEKKIRLMYGAWAGLTCEYPQLSGQCQGLRVPSSDTPIVGACRDRQVVTSLLLACCNNLLLACRDRPTRDRL
jgi:hypothetical protein